MKSQFKLAATLPERAFPRSLGPLYDYLLQRGEYSDGAGLTFDPVVDVLDTGAVAVEATLAAYSTLITTGGTQGQETVEVPSGEYVGQRKHFEAAELTDPADSVIFDVANIDTNLHAGGTPDTISGLELDAVGEFALLEWTGAAWNLLYTSGTVTNV